MILLQYALFIYTFPNPYTRTCASMLRGCLIQKIMPTANYLYVDREHMLDGGDCIYEDDD